MNRMEKMRLGRRKAFLRKCILAQDLIARYEDNTTIRGRVFEEHIEPILLCSYQQYAQYYQSSKELEEIEMKLNNLSTNTL